MIDVITSELQNINLFIQKNSSWLSQTLNDALKPDVSKKAESGDRDAMFNVMLAYHLSASGNSDRDKALQWAQSLSDAIKNKDLVDQKAQKAEVFFTANIETDFNYIIAFIGMDYMKGINQPMDLQEAARWFDLFMTAQFGSSDAFAMMSNIQLKATIAGAYYKGISAPKDQGLAENYFNKIIALAKPEMQPEAEQIICLLQASSWGGVVDKADEADALARLHRLAEKGYAKANLAIAYILAEDNDQHVNQDVINNLLAAADKGDAEAQCSLATAFAQKEITATYNPAEAMWWARVAASQNIPCGRAILAKFYMEGEVTPKDIDKGLMWHSISGINLPNDIKDIYHALPKQQQSSILAAAGRFKAPQYTDCH